MGQLEEFETTLSEVVSAKRLSASKMTNLSEMALKNMESDTQLVSVLYRTHKSLSTAAKVNSLYVFDAIARAAKSQVNKKHLSADRHTGKGNAATFLTKLESVLDGLFQDMASISSSSTKEKTQKILDIWAKGQTFPQPVLTRLTAITQGKQGGAVGVTKESSMPPVSTTPPGPPPSNPFSLLSPPTTTPTPTITPAQDAQAALIALLTRAAQASNAPSSGTTPNLAVQQQPLAPPHPNPLSALNIIQQLTETAKLHASSVPAAVPQPAPPINHVHPNQPSTSYDTFNNRPYQDNSYQNHHSNDPRRRDQGQNGGPNGYGAPSRGAFRGGFRGRGRGGRPQWGEDRDRDWGEQSPRRSEQRSRSRSPSRQANNRRDPRLRSPTRYADAEPSSTQAQLDRDEFGRDVRPDSPPTTASGVSTPPPQPLGSSGVATRDPRRPPPAPASNVQPPPASAPSSTAAASTSVSSQTPPVASTSTTISSTSTQLPAEIPSASTDPAPLGLDTFNLMAFNFTDPTAWQDLANRWVHTNGTTPMQEELMQFVMMGGMGLTPQFPSNDMSNNQWGGGWQNGSSGYDSSSYQAGDSTFAAVQDSLPPETEGTSSSTGGKMQKVGDKWMFIRTAPTETV